MTQRQVATKKKALSYRSADRAGTTRILDELDELTGWHRDYTRAALRTALTLKVVKPRAGRALKYEPAVTRALAKCWAAHWSVRNKAEKSVFEALMHVRRVFLFPIIRMDAEFTRVHSAAQSRQILALTGHLETLALERNPQP